MIHKAASKWKDYQICPNVISCLKILTFYSWQLLCVSLGWISATMQCIPLSVLRLLPQINHQLHKQPVIRAGRHKTCSALTMASEKAPHVLTLTFVQIAPPEKLFFPLTSCLHHKHTFDLNTRETSVSVHKHPASLLPQRFYPVPCNAERTSLVFFSSSSLELWGRGEEEANVRVFLFLFCVSKILVSVGHCLMTASAESVLSKVAC